MNKKPRQSLGKKSKNYERLRGIQTENRQKAQTVKKKKKNLTLPVVLPIIICIMARAQPNMTNMLRKVIKNSKMSYCAIERETGIDRSSLMRFMRCEQSLRLDLADRLADYFGLEVIKRKDK